MYVGNFLMKLMITSTSLDRFWTKPQAHADEI